MPQFQKKAIHHRWILFYNEERLNHREIFVSRISAITMEDPLEVEQPSHESMESRSFKNEELRRALFSSLLLEKVRSNFFTYCRKM